MTPAFPTITPEEFLRRLSLRMNDHDWIYGSADHHLTGPLSAQQSPNQGSVFHNEGCILGALANQLGGPILEIGSDLGISTRYLHEGLDKHGGPGGIIAVDYCHKWDDDPDWPRRVRLEMDTHADASIRRLAGYGPFTFAFIDGDHRYDGVMQDIRLCLELDVHRLLFHDTSAACPVPTNPSDGSEARRAVIKFFMSRPWKVWDITSQAGLMYAECLA